MRIHLEKTIFTIVYMWFFYQGFIQSLPLEKLKADYGEEEICVGDHCLYLYLP